jgi:hypothetical protein
MVRAEGIEPSSHAWEARIIADILCPQLVSRVDVNHCLFLQRKFAPLLLGYVRGVEAISKFKKGVICAPAIGVRPYNAK